MRAVPLLCVVVAVMGCKVEERPASTVPITTKILLRYHPPAGASYTYVLDQTSRIAPDTFATDTGSQNTLHLALRQTVGAAVSEDSVAVTATLDSGVLTSPMLSPAAAQDAARRLRGVHLTAVFDDRQRLIHDDWTGVRRLPGIVGDQLQLVFRAAALALPEDSVKTGDSWANTVVLPFGQVAGGAPLIAKTKIQVRELSVLAIRSRVSAWKPACPTVRCGSPSEARRSRSRCRESSPANSASPSRAARSSRRTWAA
mgnify:CR=1 FL=1